MPPKTSKDSPTACVSKFRFQYLDCKAIQDLTPGSFYWDRVSLSIPCAEIWQKALQDPRFSCVVDISTSSDTDAQPSRRLLTYPEMLNGKVDGKPLFNELAVFVYQNVSEECRRQWAATQYWRARVKSFAMWHQEHRERDGIESVVIEDLPDPVAMTKGSADPYYRREEGIDDEHYNALRQSQRVAATQVPFLNTLRMCYAEISAPHGSLVLLRGQSKCSGKYVLAEYAERPEDELDSWRLAEYDEPLSGYRIPVEGASDEQKKTKRVAYPWRRRKVRVICEIPKDVLQKRGSNSVIRQGSSSRVLLRGDVAMLRAYAAKIGPKALATRGKEATLKRPASLISGSIGALKRPAAFVPVAEEVAEVEEQANSGTNELQQEAPQWRIARELVCPAPSLAIVVNTPKPPPLSPTAKKTFKSLYDLLERTHFPKGCRSSASVTGFIPRNYLIFGLHRAGRWAPCPNKLELTAATSFAFGELGTEAPIASRLHSPPAQYRELVVALLKQLLELGMQEPRRGAAKGILNPVTGQIIPPKQVRFTSVMVAKNKRTYFHRDSNNRGESYQVVITDPDKVDSGEFVGGNLLCWPGISKEEANRRTREVLSFHDTRKLKRKRRRDEHRQKRRELTPCNSRWKGSKDEVENVRDDDESPSESESDENFVLHEKQVDVSNVRLEEDIEDVEDRSLDSHQVPSYEGDATVVECVNRYISFAGRDVWHATQPWKAIEIADESLGKRRANRYCITFFAVDLKDEDGAAYKNELREKLVRMGFRPNDPAMASTSHSLRKGKTKSTKANLALKRKR